MARIEIEGAEIDVPRNGALLDTNVLAAYINDKDALHEHTAAFMQLSREYTWLVTIPVIVESCGLLAKRRHQKTALNLIEWLLTPGNAIVIPSLHPPRMASTMLATHRDWMTANRIDYVDAYLIETAHRLTAECGIRPHMPIVTFDTGDYTRCANRGFQYSIFDVHVLELLEFQ